MKKIATSNVSVVNINDGYQYYNWVKYASSATPEASDMSDDPTGKTYVGFAYNKETRTPSLRYQDYDWMRLDGHSISNIRNIYCSSTETDPENISAPFTNSADVLHFKQGAVYTEDGYLVFNNQKSEWSYTKPSFEYGKHLWISMEISTNEGGLIYTFPQLSQEWEVNYMRVGGTNLIRNSKSLIDSKIYWKE